MKFQKNKYPLEEPSIELKKNMHELYMKVFESSFTNQKKINLLSSIGGWEPWSWRVVGITTNAVKRIWDCGGHANVRKELVRDHFFQGRVVTYKKMLEKKLSFESWWSEFWENDRTILMTKREHRIIKWESQNDLWKNPQDRIFDIDWTCGNFVSNKVAGFHYSNKKEGEFVLRNFGDKINVSEKKPDFSIVTKKI